MVYDKDGNPLVSPSGGESKYILVGTVLDANSDSDRFVAMKELLDIGKKKMADPEAVISDSEFTHATKGAVCVLPVGHSSMYEKYPFVPLYSKNADTQAVPASVTKVMSLITGMDYLSTVKDVITITSTDPEGGSGAYFSAGDTMTIEELMLAMMLPSSNTAAKAFARVCGEKMLKSVADGTYTDAQCRTEFISQMNKKAAYIGMSDSYFDSPSGASGNIHTTANDLIRLVVEATSYPQICKVWNKKSYTIAVGGTNPRNVQLTSTVQNTAIENSYYIFGGKTGSLTSPRSAALVMVAEPK